MWSDMEDADIGRFGSIVVPSSLSMQKPVQQRINCEILPTQCCLPLTICRTPNSPPIVTIVVNAGGGNCPLSVFKLVRRQLVVTKNSNATEYRMWRPKLLKLPCASRGAAGPAPAKHCPAHRLPLLLSNWRWRRWAVASVAAAPRRGCTTGRPCSAEATCRRTSCGTCGRTATAGAPLRPRSRTSRRHNWHALPGATARKGTAPEATARSTPRKPPSEEHSANRPARRRYPYPRRASGRPPSSRRASRSPPP
mmetsp:Transcript_155320/g.498339  ORF Transcript_155320/g.498339 Transcript_155320/m.498339 type:complete len:252 (-) Transcript_155320:597-1352(-)